MTALRSMQKQLRQTMEYYMDPDTAHAQASYLANVDNVEVVDRLYS